MFRAFNLKIFRRELNRSSPTLTANCVAQSLLKIEPEWVAILIRLCFVTTLMATTAFAHLMLTNFVFCQLANKVAQSIGPNFAQAFWREL